MGNRKISRSIVLTGTEQPDVPGRMLHAGPLSVEFDNGNLRYVRLNGVEVLRAIAFLVRDENWGTYVPEVCGLKVEQSDKGFVVTYAATCRRGSQSLDYVATIEGRADGSLTFDATALPATDFLTARTGFVVLHPLEGVVGQPLSVTHTDGSVTRSSFPEQVSPDCPFRDIRELEHEARPGLWVRVRMVGDAFEMEDHRNWTDASFKTYVRPLSRPWPYVLPHGEPVRQQVEFSFRGTLPRAVAPGNESADAIVVEAGDGRAVPVIGLGLPPEEADAALACEGLLKQLAPNFLVCSYDARLGHGVGLLRKYAQIAERLGAEVMLEAVVQSVSGFAEELRQLASQVRQAGLVLESVALCPVGHLKSVLPGGVYPPAPDLGQLYRAARNAFPGIRLGGGMFSFFTELNRKRPPVAELDFITNTTSPIVHAADDRSVMETLAALPWQVDTARAFSEGKPHRVGPSGIGARDNPHGATYSENPDNQRICLAKMDPRQRGLFSAAWTLGYVATLANAGVDRVSLSAPTGPLGVIYRRGDHAQPCFDDLPAADSASAVYPVFHVIAALNCASGARLLGTRLTQTGKTAALAWARDGERWLLVANLTDDVRDVKLAGLGGTARVSILDAAHFVEATTDAQGFRARASDLAGNGTLRLDAYGVACIHVPRNPDEA